VLVGVVKRSRILVVAAIAAAGATLGGAADAVACSCVYPGPESVRASDAAVVAKLIDVKVTGDPTPGYSGDEDADFRYRVKRVYKGRHRLERGEELAVRSNLSSAACGLPAQEDRNYGLLLYRRAQRWQANLCTVTTPRHLRKLARDRQGARSRAGAGAGCGT
jgi:hypothetical protein